LIPRPLAEEPHFRPWLSSSISVGGNHGKRRAGTRWQVDRKGQALELGVRLHSRWQGDMARYEEPGERRRSVVPGTERRQHVVERLVHQGELEASDHAAAAIWLV